MSSLIRQKELNGFKLIIPGLLSNMSSREVGTELMIFPSYEEKVFQSDYMLF